MQENEVIGIAGVFLLTFCLIALYQLIGALGRHGKRYGAHSKQVNEHDQDRRQTHQMNSQEPLTQWRLGALIK